MSDNADRRFMARALELARRGLYSTHPNPRVGCVLVREGLIVGEGWHERAGEPHAEVNALRQAGTRAGGATAYVTLEPCCHHGRTPPCTNALLEAGIRRVVSAMSDPDPRVAGKGLEQLRAAGITVASGLLQAQAEALNPGFIARLRRGRPFVRCKLAMTLDGRIATAHGESRWITSAEARSDVQRLRARSSAIMSGIGTVLADDPSLTVRSDDLDLGDMNAFVDLATLQQPLRVIVDSGLRIPASSRVLAGPGRVVIATAVEQMRRDIERRGNEIELITFAGADGRVDLSALLACLAERRVNEVLLEAGPVLSGAMLKARLIDEILIYMAPKLLGDTGRGLFAIPGLARLDQAFGLVIDDVRAVGGDWRITARVEAQEPSG